MMMMMMMSEPSLNHSLTGHGTRRARISVLYFVLY